MHRFFFERPMILNACPAAPSSQFWLDDSSPLDILRITPGFSARGPFGCNVCQSIQQCHQPSIRDYESSGPTELINCDKMPWNQSTGFGKRGSLTLLFIHVSFLTPTSPSKPAHDPFIPLIAPFLLANKPPAASTAHTSSSSSPSS
jgi:hypothetical protein